MCSLVEHHMFRVCQVKAQVPPPRSILQTPLKRRRQPQRLLEYIYIHPCQGQVQHSLRSTTSPRLAQAVLGSRHYHCVAAAAVAAAVAAAAAAAVVEVGD